MAEVIEVLSSVSGLAAALIKISATIQTFAGGQKEASDLYFQVQALMKVNSTLEQALKDNKATPTPGWVNLTNSVIQPCMTVVADLQARLEKPTARMSLSKKISWSMNRREVTMLCVQLKDYGQMLGNLQFNLLHQSNYRQETIAVEIVAKVTQLQRDFASMQQSMPTGAPTGNPPVDPLLFPSYGSSQYNSGTSAPVVDPYGLSQAAQAAVNTTAVGSQHQPPAYIPQQNQLQWPVRSAKFKHGNLGPGTLSLSRIGGLPILMYTAAKMDGYEIKWQVGNITRATKTSGASTQARTPEANISMAGLSLQAEQSFDTDLSVNCDDESAAEIVTMISSAAAMTNISPIEKKHVQIRKIWINSSIAGALILSVSIYLGVFVDSVAAFGVAFWGGFYPSGLHRHSCGQPAQNMTPDMSLE